MTNRAFRVAKAAMVVAIVGLVLPPLSLVAIALGVLATRWAAGADAVAARRLGKIAVGVSMIGLALLGGLLLFATQRVGRGELGAECRIGLEALRTAQEGYRQSRGFYAGSREELGFWPESPQVSYFISADGAHGEELLRLGVGRVGTCPECRSTMACRVTSSEGQAEWWTLSIQPAGVDGGAGGESLPVRVGLATP